MMVVVHVLKTHEKRSLERSCFFLQEMEPLPKQKGTGTISCKARYYGAIMEVSFVKFRVKSRFIWPLLRKHDKSSGFHMHSH